MKQRFSLVLALGLAAVAGCSDDDVDPNAANARIRNESGFCTEWARVVCNRNVVTACEYEAGVDACRDFQLGFCLDLVPTGYSSARAQKCLDAAKTAFSDATITAEEAAEVLNFGGDCSRLIDGGLDVGDPCSSDFDCNMVDDHRCVIKPGNTEGTCQVPTVAMGGQRCNNAAVVCDEGNYCNGQNCVEVLSSGDECNNDAECGSAALCVVGGDDTGLCTPKVEAPGVCTADRDCVSNFCVGGRCRLRVMMSVSVPGFCVEES